MKRLTIAGLMATLTLGTFIVVAAAQVIITPPVPGVTAPPEPPPPAKIWPSTLGQTSVVEEWYSDIPWTQKLGTYRGNEIDEAIVLPYDALGQPEKDLCGNPTDLAKQAACMIEMGVNFQLLQNRYSLQYNR